MKSNKSDCKSLINNYTGGDLDLSGCEMKELTLSHIDGNLNLTGAKIGTLSIGWVKRELNMSRAEIKTIVNPIDAESVIASAASVKKWPSHIYANYLDMSKCDWPKVNTEVICSSTLENLPKNMNVKCLVLDSKTAKKFPLSAVMNFDSVNIDNSVVSVQHNSDCNSLNNSSTECCAIAK